MSTIRVDTIEGYTNSNEVSIATGITGVTLDDFFSGSPPSTAIMKPYDLMTKGPWVDARFYGSSKNELTLGVAISTIGSSERTLVIAPGTWTISGSLTFPSNISVFFYQGAKFQVAGGVSVTFGGALVAGPYRIFTGTGTVTVGAKTPLTYSEWSGTSGDYVKFQTFPILPTSNPTTTYQAVHKGYVDSKTVPVGAVLPYAGATAPSGWFICDGSAKSRSTYATLFALIEETYGVGDGSTTFNIPDMRGRAPFGVNSANPKFAALNDSGGSEEVSLLAEEVPNYTADGGFSTGYFWPTYTAANGQVEGHENLPPYRALNFIIKY